MNSCQAMKDGGRITVRSSVVDAEMPSGQPKRLAAIQITDNGAGISADELPMVFDPFFTTKKSGTGLGLPICLEILTHHEGHIDLSSELGHGTSVTVSLTLRTA
jgi:signal transduction histidine kinase